MIYFGIDHAGFNNELRCGTVNLFDGWVVNPDKTNPITDVLFIIDEIQIGKIHIKADRPDMEKAFDQLVVGFYGVCEIPEIYINKSVKLFAWAQDGTTHFMSEYLVNKGLSQDEKDFRGNNALPGDLLMHLVVHNVDPVSFLNEGKASAEMTRAILDQNNLDFVSMKNVLDFGVGCGRVFRWWREYASIINFWGSDINPVLINWCIENLDFGNFSVNNLQAPTVYNDLQFNLIYLYSVFTHLAVETQREWLDEFSRILAPGGVVIVTVHGDHHANFLPPTSQEIYRQNGYCILSHNAEGENLCASYQNNQFCQELFSGNFRIINYYPTKIMGGQDLYILQKK